MAVKIACLSFNSTKTHTCYTDKFRSIILLREVSYSHVCEISEKHPHHRLLNLSIYDIFPSFQSLWALLFACPSCRFLVGGFNPFEKYDRQTWVHLPQIFGVKIKKYLKLPPPRDRYNIHTGISKFP